MSIETLVNLEFEEGQCDELLEELKTAARQMDSFGPVYPQRIYDLIEILEDSHVLDNKGL